MRRKDLFLASLPLAFILLSTMQLAHADSINLAPVSQLPPLGGVATVTATVLDKIGNGEAGVTVTFTDTAGPNALTTGTAATDILGNAAFTYVDNGGIGTDQLVSSFVDSSNATHLSNTVTVGWAANTITLAPLNQDFPVGGTATVTATLRTPNGLDVVGETVFFADITGPDAGTQGSAVTDALGEAMFTFNDVGGMGTDQLVSSFIDVFNNPHPSNTVTVGWGVATTHVPEPSSIVLLLSVLGGVSFLIRKRANAV